MSVNNTASNQCSVFKLIASYSSPNLPKSRLNFTTMIRNLYIWKDDIIRYIVTKNDYGMSVSESCKKIQKRCNG